MKTDAPEDPLLHLTLVGNINKFVTIEPQRVILRGFAGNQITHKVRIIPEENYPFKILGDREVRKKNIRYELTEAQRSKKTEYILTVANLKKQKGRYYDLIKLKTDSKIRPDIRIRVYGNIFDRPPGVKKNP